MILAAWLRPYPLEPYRGGCDAFRAHRCVARRHRCSPRQITHRPVETLRKLPLGLRAERVVDVDRLQRKAALDAEGCGERDERLLDGPESGASHVQEARL
jgi:hypothetical protein